MNEKTLNNLTYLYILTPIIIFLLGWCKIYIAIPLSILIVISYVLRLEKVKLISILDFVIENKKEIIITILIAIIYVFISGIGGYVYQNPDHVYRNTLLKELIENNWPIYYHQQGLFNNDTILIYYFALWLPASIFGKIGGYHLASLMLFIWCMIGVILTFSYLKKYYKGKYYAPIVLFIFFSGLDIVERFLYGENILDIIFLSTHIEWIRYFQMSSFTTQIFWVYNQAIPAWLVTLFILKEKNNKYIGVILAMSLLFCTLPSIGLILIFIYKILYESLLSQKDKNIKTWLIDTFSWQNIIIGIPILLINYLFLKYNLSGNKINFGINGYQLLNVIIIIIFEFGIYYFITYKYVKNKPLYWTSFLSLLICPFIRIGYSQDFCMRACIPGQIIMFTFVIETIYELKIKKDRSIKFIYIILALGAITPLNEIRRTIINTDNSTKMEYIDLSNCDNSYNFYGNKNENIFVKYIAKK